MVQEGEAFTPRNGHHLTPTQEQQAGPPPQLISLQKTCPTYTSTTIRMRKSITLPRQCPHTSRVAQTACRALRCCRHATSIFIVNGSSSKPRPLLQVLRKACRKNERVISLYRPPRRSGFTTQFRSRMSHTCVEHLEMGWRIISHNK